MTTIVCGATVALVESRSTSMKCSAYPSRLAMVLDVLDNGAIGGPNGYYGSDDHKAALDAVEKQIAATRARISHQEACEAKLAAEPRTPPCLQCGAMTREEAAIKCLGAAVDDCHGNRLWGD
jgi:hypothetical protein